MTATNLTATATQFEELMSRESNGISVSLFSMARTTASPSACSTPRASRRSSSRSVRPRRSTSSITRLRMPPTEAFSLSHRPAGAWRTRKRPSPSPRQSTAAPPPAAGPQPAADSRTREEDKCHPADTRSVRSAQADTQILMGQNSSAINVAGTSQLIVFPVWIEVASYVKPASYGSWVLMHDRHAAPLHTREQPDRHAPHRPRRPRQLLGGWVLRSGSAPPAASGASGSGRRRPRI